MDRKGGHIASMQATKPLNSFVRKGTTPIQKGEPRHCGNLKDKWFDPQLLISPLRENCEAHFMYLGDGRIQVNSETNCAAKTTIKKLGLDIAKLNSLRELAIEPFLDPNLTSAEFQEFVNLYLHKDSRGRFQPFWTTIHYIFGEALKP